MTRIIIIVSFLVLFMVGCASQVPPPVPKGNEEAAWLDYYESLFKIYGDKTLPPRESDPESARIAYMKAGAKWKKNKDDWNELSWALAIISISLAILPFVKYQK